MKEENFDDFPAIGGLMVSKKIMDEGLNPMFMFREKRTGPADSGWRIMSGTESDDYINNPDNIGIYNPETLLKIDTSIKDLLLHGVGFVYERTSEDEDWYRVYDYKLNDDFMVEHWIAKDCSFKINNLFERFEEEDGDLMYTTGDKTIRIAVWYFGNRSQEELLKKEREKFTNRTSTDASILETYDLSDRIVSRVGHKIRESDDEKEYDVIYACSIVNSDLVQLAFYFDNPEDESWAIETWKGIRFESVEGNAVSDV